MDMNDHEWIVLVDSDVDLAVNWVAGPFSAFHRTWPVGMPSPKEKPLAVLILAKDTCNTWIHENILGSPKFAPKLQNADSCVRCMKAYES